MSDWRPPAPRKADCVLKRSSPPSPAAMRRSATPLPPNTPQRVRSRHVEPSSGEESVRASSGAPSQASLSSLSDHAVNSDYGDVEDGEWLDPLSPGTVTRESVSTPLAPLPPLARDSPVVSCTRSSGGVTRDSPIKRSGRPPANSLLMHPPTTASAAGAQSGGATSKGKGKEKAKGRSPGRHEREWVIPKDREIFVVVRGAHPGIYFDRCVLFPTTSQARLTPNAATPPSSCWGPIPG